VTTRSKNNYFFEKEECLIEIYTVAFPKEYDDLAYCIMEMSNENRQSISKTIRDILCEYLCFEPILEKGIKKPKKSQE
jgi:hypothetical protein